MPLYNKALKFKSGDLEKMSFDECSELLLCFRYLHFRDDHPISKEKITEHIAAINKHLEYLNNQSIADKEGK
jgi:hypothetical protein